MATLQSTVDVIAENMSGAGNITSRKMFGEYALYLDGKVIAFICDDNFYIKPTEEGKKFYPDFEDAPPYPGAKMYMLISEDTWEDREFMTKLAIITANSLPTPKPKRKRT
ncbi:MAG: TfoX/Sxy family protein [Candidatus Levybacteria bacterium]|nr:TfoX/Sxy family protein [Candidatus Levybacteria bacterium]